MAAEVWREGDGWSFEKGMEGKSLMLEDIFAGLVPWRLKIAKCFG